MGRVRGILRSVWSEPRPAGAPARGWRDWALVALLVPATLIEGILRTDLLMRWVQVGIVLALVPTLLHRRSHPLLMVAVAFAVCGLAPLVLGGDLQMNVFVFMLLLAYAAFRWGSGREAVLSAAIVTAKIAASWIARYLSLGEAILGLVLLTLVGALATAQRFRTRARLRELESVKLLERERLARDLHDTVAHHVSAMAIRAQAGLATMATRPDAAADALRVIEAEASRTLAEMRTMVHALRRDDGDAAEFAPNPRIRDLAELASANGGGPVVEVELEGELDGLPSAVDSAVYRLAQESVTNARRHARHATRVRVRVVADQEAVRLDVSDDGEPSGVSGQGYGLVGMAERASLLGGTCQAGPRPGRGWSVVAVLPRAGS